eukprot:TRINITY_DN2_c1_g2_i1.p1 TRINITY_DN2_c1_g2~~TRINITY_DN2_c1_g2_i1.p1  ORF type:complete len:421 (+),score=134.19 TRINITY_DN2_c1_g2_i1:632-1894(+)
MPSDDETSNTISSFQRNNQSCERDFAVLKTQLTYNMSTRLTLLNAVRIIRKYPTLCIADVLEWLPTAIAGRLRSLARARLRSDLTEKERRRDMLAKMTEHQQKENEKQTKKEQKAEKWIEMCGGAIVLEGESIPVTDVLLFDLALKEGAEWVFSLKELKAQLVIRNVSIHLFPKDVVSLYEKKGLLNTHNKFSVTGKKDRIEERLRFALECERTLSFKPPLRTESPSVSISSVASSSSSSISSISSSSSSSASSSSSSLSSSTTSALLSSSLVHHSSSSSSYRSIFSTQPLLSSSSANSSSSSSMSSLSVTSQSVDVLSSSSSLSIPAPPSLPSVSYSLASFFSSSGSGFSSASATTRRRPARRSTLKRISYKEEDDDEEADDHLGQSFYHLREQTDPTKRRRCPPTREDFWNYDAIDID